MGLLNLHVFDDRLTFSCSHVTRIWWIVMKKLWVVGHIHHNNAKTKFHQIRWNVYPVEIQMSLHTTVLIGQLGKSLEICSRNIMFQFLFYTLKVFELHRLICIYWCSIWFQDVSSTVNNPHIIITLLIIQGKHM